MDKSVFTPSVSMLCEYKSRSYLEPEGSELSKLLDMKGIKRSEQSQVIELFKEHQRRALVAEEKSGGGELNINWRT